MADRLPPLTEDQLDDEQRKLWSAITEVPRIIPAVNDAGHLLGPYDVMLRTPKTGVLLSKLGADLRLTTVIPVRLRELCTLAVSQHWHCDYTWLVHAEVGRQAGLTPGIIEAIQAGRDPELDDEADEVAYRVTTQLLRTGSVDDGTFAAARRVFGDRGAVELLVFVGHCTIVALILNAFEVPLRGPAAVFGRDSTHPHPVQVDFRQDSLKRRFAAIPPEDRTPEQRELWDSIVNKPRPLESVDEDGHLLGPYDVLLQTPYVGQLVGDFGVGLRANTEVSRRLMEIAVLVTTAHFRCEMLWVGHDPQARAEGIGEHVIFAIRDGKEPDFGQEPDLAAIFKLASELVRTGTLTQATYDECRQLLGTKGLIEIVLLVAHYCLQSFLISGGQVPPLEHRKPVWTA